MKDARLQGEHERRQIRQYLLGMLSEEEAAQLDEQIFTNNEILERFEDEQELLIEDFVNQELSREEAARFREQCSRSPVLRRSVDDLKALLTGLGRDPRLHPDKQPSHGWRRWFALSAPAMAVALCCVGVLYVHERGVSRDLQARLGSASLASHEPATARPVAPRPMAEGQPYVAFLGAEVVRGTGSVPHLRFPANRSAVTLQVEVRTPAAENSLWTVAVLENGASVWKSTRVPLRVTGEERFLELDLSARVLQAGAYTLQFSSSRNAQTIQTRQFVIDAGS
ncbi:MAG TPA: hypothetical protein VHX37_12185 [Acidobacteriaceae bacterium]|nr:hypothetical protein [Acidobacteriaceae bacterium]